MRDLIDRILSDERGEIEDAPALIFLVGGVLFVVAAALFIAGQYANAQTQVQAAAFAAARDVSLSGSTDTAATLQTRAEEAARRTLSTGADCRTIAVIIDTSRRTTALDEPGTVAATVSCDLHYQTISALGLPVTALITRTATSPTDPFRPQR